MGFINRIFAPKEDPLKCALLETQMAILQLYGVSKPTAAQKVKTSVYLCIAVTAILNDFRGSQARKLIDRVAGESGRLVTPLRMLVRELANDDEELTQVLATFPPDLKISALTSINGLGAFDALYHAMVQPLISEIWAHRDGPTGTQGYASIVVARGLFGKSEGDEKMAQCFVPTMFQLNELAIKLTQLM
jgi:hypothetical protein